MMHRNLGQLQRQCLSLDLEPLPTKKTKEGEPKFLKKDYIKALREYFIGENFPDGPPEHLKIMLEIESLMLCYRYNSLKPEQQEEIWTSETWGVGEKFDGCRMGAIFVRGEGLHFYSRNISVEDFCPIHYENIWHHTDEGELGKYFNSFFIDSEVMCENPNICSILDNDGIPTETVLQAVQTLLALNKEESIATQKAMAPLGFKSFDVLMVNGDWSPLEWPLRKRRKGLKRIAGILKRCGMDIIVEDLLYQEEAKRQRYEEILDAGGEGVVAKNMDYPYCTTTSRKRDSWVKVKRSMKGSLTSSGYGDTLDGWISGFQLGEPGKGWEDFVGAIHVSIYIRDSKGTNKEHHIATIPGLTKELREEMTEIGEEGVPRMKDEYMGRVVEIDGQSISSRSKRLKHAKLIRFRDDKYPELCILEEEFLNTMIL